MTLVFNVSCVLAAAFLLWGAVAPEQLAQVTNSIQVLLLEKMGWFYLMSVTGFLISALFFAFSRYGMIRLGREDEPPEFPLPTWFAMLFAAGMGIGLVFWGVAEPAMHYYTPPTGPGETRMAAQVALRASFFHWGLHAWGIYTVVALCLAYTQFCRNRPGLMSQACQPLLGTWVEGPVGSLIDIIAVFATVFGVATSLGFGAMQITGGLAHLFAIPNTFPTQLTIIGVVTVLYMTSAQTGIQRGIKYLSNMNMVLAIGLLLFMLFVGPTNFIMDAFTSTLGEYLQNLPRMSFNLGFLKSSEWVRDWTLFYWAWWIAWAPFVGTFIARISRGRTVREFVLGVLVVPTLFCGLWFAVFGGTALWVELFEEGTLKTVIQDQGVEVALFTLLGQFSFGTATSLLAMVLIATFFVTSADSATFVLGTLTTNGDLNPPNRIKFTWGVIQSLAAAVLLWSGGLQALQTGSILAAFPFAFVIILMIIALFKAFQEEARPSKGDRPR